MKVKCVDNLNGELSLTLGKEYEVLEEYLSEYRVINDNGSKVLYSKNRFEVVKDKQQIKLQCQECLHQQVCGHRDEWKRYCEEHIELRKKSVLFDVEPSCRYYIDKSVLEKDKTEEVEVKKTAIDKKILDNFKKQPLIYTRPDNEIFKEDLRWNFDNKKVKTEDGWKYKGGELNHVVEDTTSKERKLNEDEFIALLSKILKV